MINSNNIKISVIVPVYNAEKTIKRCVDSIIEQTLDFNLPHKVLCNEDCEGLCPECGANLNKETCSCSETASDEDFIDPRFAKLKDLFKND